MSNTQLVSINSLSYPDSGNPFLIDSIPSRRTPKFTQKRGAIEGRSIPKEVFIEQFLAARTVVQAIKKEFGDSIRLWLIENKKVLEKAAQLANEDQRKLYYGTTP